MGARRLAGRAASFLYMSWGSKCQVSGCCLRGSGRLTELREVYNGHLQLLVSPRDSHENLPAIGGGTQVADFCRGNTKGIFQKNQEL